jgi:hypothetical protein
VRLHINPKPNVTKDTLKFNLPAEAFARKTNSLQHVTYRLDLQGRGMSVICRLPALTSNVYMKEIHVSETLSTTNNIQIICTKTAGFANSLSVMSYSNNAF